MIGVAVRADDREDLAVAHRVKHRRRIAAWIDDDDLFVVTDDPDVDGSVIAVRRRGRRELIDSCAHPSVPSSFCLTRRPSYHSHLGSVAGRHERRRVAAGERYLTWRRRARTRGRAAK